MVMQWVLHDSTVITGRHGLGSGWAHASSGPSLFFMESKLHPFNQSGCSFKPKLVYKINGPDLGQFRTIGYLYSCYNVSACHALKSLKILKKEKVKYKEKGINFISKPNDKNKRVDDIFV